MPSASQALRDYLNAHRHDPMSDQEELVRLLAQVWPSLAGASDEAMAGWKLDRMEDVSWEPPLLSFRIERHGGTRLGSTRASMQIWTIDLDAGTATCKVAGESA